LLTRIREEGIREPILLGTDGRVWDGHHRITVAMHLGLESVPVEFASEDGALAALRAEWEAEGRRWFTPAYRALVVNIITSGHEPVVPEHARRQVDPFTREHPEGPACFVATRVLPPLAPLEQEGESDGF